MLKTTQLVLVAGAMALLAGCSSGSLLGNRQRPDEFAVQRQAPLVVPPDFSLEPPQPGAPRPSDNTASQQALDAMFGGPAPRSAVESDSISRAGTSDPGIRTSVGDSQTFTVDKGNTTRTIIAAPEGDGQDARATIPG